MFKDAAVHRAGVWVLAGLLYWLWPFDVVPDFAVVIGWADDLLVAALTLYMAYKAFQKRLKRGPTPDDERRQ
ncbi:MAG: DUF1232 domain-containing protein [Elusimicrobia bacterium]|nr:DUF1232 domain-containing protein [Elusimicrobiota bacterium]